MASSSFFFEQTEEQENEQEQEEEQAGGGTVLPNDVTSRLVVKAALTTLDVLTTSFIEGLGEECNAMLRLQEELRLQQQQQTAASLSRPKKKQAGPRHRNRRSVRDVYQSMGAALFRRAFRMSYQSFLNLHRKLRPLIENFVQRTASQPSRGNTATTIRRRRTQKKPWASPPIPNGGPITSSVRLACALRYFAGGKAYGIMETFGIGHSEVYRSVCVIIEAVNKYKPFQIEYPSSHEHQRWIASQFKEKSSVGFSNCAGCIDGILIWMHKPTVKDAETCGVGRQKFYCGRKGKFGLNCQAVSDCRGRILSISIHYGGATSDLLSFEASRLHSRLETGTLLAPGLVLYGDNAYLNNKYMVTPYPNVSSGSKDDYNFFHSQVSDLCFWWC